MAWESRNGQLVEIDAEGNEIHSTQPWEKYMTREQHLRLPYYGMWMADYWTKWLPKTCQKMAKQQNLVEFFTEKGLDYLEEVAELMRNGMSQDGAEEIIKEKIFLPPEI